MSSIEVQAQPTTMQDNCVAGVQYRNLKHLFFHDVHIKCCRHELVRN